jgi:hemimethylated DNA binding protein
MYSDYTDKADITFQRDIGMSVIRYGRSRAAHLMKDSWTGKDPAVCFSVGDVFTHRKWGYTAVVCGWDTTCQQSKHWQQRNRTDVLSGGAEQPFFHALVHTADCSAKDSTVTYVAQENILLDQGTTQEQAESQAARVPGDDDDEKPVANFPPVLHPEIGDFFVAYCPLTRKYLPRETLREAYPDDD